MDKFECIIKSVTEKYKNKEKDKLEYFRKSVKDLLGYNYGITTMFNPDTGKIEVSIFKDGRDDGVTLELNEWNLTSDRVAEQVAEIVQTYYMTVRAYK